MNIDLYEYVRGERPWAQLYRFMSRLPVHGHFHASIMDDPESVELISQQMQDRSGENQKVSMLGWTAELNLLATIIDVLSEMHATLIQINSEGNKRPSVSHMPRPVSAIDKLESKRAIAEHKQRVKEWLGRGD